MGVSTGPLTIWQPASPKVSDERERERQRDREDQDGSPNIFYNLSSDVLSHLSVIPTNPSRMWEVTTPGCEYQEAGIIGAVFEIDYRSWAGAGVGGTARLLCLHLHLCEWCHLMFCSVQHTQLYMVAQVRKSGGFVLNPFPSLLRINSFIHLCNKHLLNTWCMPLCRCYTS